MRLDLSSLEHKSTHFEQWTLTVDLQVESLPMMEQSILQCNSDPNNLRHTSEAVLYPMGCVSIFDEVARADEKTWLGPQKWCRVTLRMGNSPTTGEKCMTVFVNGKQSVEIRKGVFDQVFLSY